MMNTLALYRLYRHSIALCSNSIALCSNSIALCSNSIALCSTLLHSIALCRAFVINNHPYRNLTVKNLVEEHYIGVLKSCQYP